MHLTTRRTFIRQAACAALGTTGLLNTIFDLRKLSAATVPGGDYKALVCLFLYGGNDANNMIVPRDATGYASYAAARGSLALAQQSLLPLTLQNGDGRDFGFHPNMPELQQLFNSGKLAVVANVGTLVAPITRAQYLAKTRRSSAAPLLALRPVGAVANIRARSAFAHRLGRTHRRPAARA